MNLILLAVPFFFLLIAPSWSPTAWRVSTSPPGGLR